MSHTVNFAEETVRSSLEDKAFTTEQEFADVEMPSDTEVRKITHKVDRRLISICGLLVAITLLDRTNLAYANIVGMSKDLDLNVGTRYSLIALIFFVPYVAMEIPCAVLIRRIGPRWALPALALAWGVLVLGFGFVHHWTVLVGLRILLGLFEGAIFPGLIYLVSLWYTRYELHKRYSAFYSIGVVGSSCGGIVAYIFTQMGGLGGLSAWRWIFIMEGLLTVVIGTLALIFLVDYPQNAHKAWWFLTKEEATTLLRRIEADRSDTEADQEFLWAKFLRPALDMTVWGYGFIQAFSTITAYAIAYFLPIILNNELGYGAGVSQLLTTPPYVFAGVLMLIEGWLCDKWHVRGPIIIYNAIQSIVGLCILSWANSSGVRYFGVFLVTSGSNGNVPAVMSWQANNIRGHWTRTFCSAVLVSMGGLGGVIGSLVFRSQDAPHYLPGIYACIIANGLTIVVAAIMIVHFHLVNKQVQAGRRIITDHPGLEYTI